MPMKPEEIVVGGVYENQHGSQERVVYKERAGRGWALSTINVRYGGTTPWTGSAFARWATRRVDGGENA